jgi:hypothetical protein
MATISAPTLQRDSLQDCLSGTPRAHAVDRWIYVFTAAVFVAIALAGFIPSSLMKIAQVQAGTRESFPLVMHAHAVLMGSFLVVLLAQTALVATGRTALHKQLGLSALVLAPALVVVGFLLATTNYHGIWIEAQAALAGAEMPLNGPEMPPLMRRVENILLLQIRVGVLFPILLAIGLGARGRDVGLHKRLMILATSTAMGAGIVRIPWLPTTIPHDPISLDLWTLVALSPMIVWDLVRNRRLHRAYWIWLALFVPGVIATQMLWDTSAWHAMARQLMRV